MMTEGENNQFIDCGHNFFQFYDLFINAHSTVLPVELERVAGQNFTF